MNVEIFCVVIWGVEGTVAWATCVGFAGWLFGGMDSKPLL